MKKYFSSTKKISLTKSQAGFTLIELMVSLSLFIIVVLALIGSLYSVNDASRKVQAMRTVMDNISFSMEAMSRTIRTGENIICNPVCSIASGTKGDYLSTQSTLGEHRLVEFQWSTWPNGNGMIEKKSTKIISVDPVTHVPVLDLTDATAWVAMTAPEINIKEFGFYVDGISRGDTKQPSVIIKMEGEASVPNGAPVPFAIQTYLSQRAPE
jgi:type II secretory pathway pseudopilin PulG